MTAAELLARASAEGLTLRLDGDGVRYLAADGRVPSGLVDELRHHQHQIARLLREHGIDRLPAGWWEAFEERAAIMEFDGGLSRAEAERRALESTVASLGEGSHP